MKIRVNAGGKTKRVVRGKSLMLPELFPSSEGHTERFLMDRFNILSIVGSTHVSIRTAEGRSGHMRGGTQELESQGSVGG